MIRLVGHADVNGSRRDAASAPIVVLHCIKRPSSWCFPSRILLGPESLRYARFCVCLRWRAAHPKSGGNTQTTAQVSSKSLAFMTSQVALIRRCSGALAHMDVVRGLVTFMHTLIAMESGHLKRPLKIALTSLRRQVDSICMSAALSILWDT